MKSAIIDCYKNCQMPFTKNFKNNIIPNSWISKRLKVIYSSYSHHITFEKLFNSWLSSSLSYNKQLRYKKNRCNTKVAY